MTKNPKHSVARKSKKPPKQPKRKSRYDGEEDAFERQQNLLAFGDSLDGSDDRSSVGDPLEDFDQEAVMDLPSQNFLDGSDDGEYMDDEDILADEDKDGSQDEGSSWGRKRQAYYDADREDGKNKNKKQKKSKAKSKEDGEDLLAEEVAEVVKLQRRKLVQLSTSLDPDIKAKFSWTQRSGAIEFRPIVAEKSKSNEPNSLLDDVQLAQEFQQYFREIKETLEPIVSSSKGQRADGDKDEGLDFLSCKCKLLGNYCALVLRYLQLQAGKQSVPTGFQDELVRHRLLIEKLRPVELRLQHQIDSLLQATRLQDSETKAELRPGMGTFSSSGSELESEARDSKGVYKAPKVNPVSFDDGPKKKRVTFKLAEDVPEEGDVPEEVGLSTYKAAHVQDRALKDLEAKTSYEEENFVRFTLSKRDKTQLKLREKLRDDLDDLESFMDDYDAHAVKKRQAEGGLRVAVRKIDKSADVEIDSDEFDSDREEAKGDNDNDDNDNGKNGGKDKKERKLEKRQSKLQLRQQQRPRQHRPMEDLAPGADRPASRAILNNRGLMVPRNRDVKNPRVKQRRKFERATKRLPSQHAVFRAGRRPAASYGGEATGIRTDIVRSTKFQQ